MRIYRTSPWLMALVVSSAAVPMLNALEPPPGGSGQPATQSELTAGLLDLLKEPAKDNSPASQNSSPSMPDPGTAPSANDADPGLKAKAGQEPPDPNPSLEPGRDRESSAGASQPLAEVQQGMQTLAGWLRSKSEVQRTKQLQRDIVTRLDDMIGQLEQANTQTSPSTSGPTSPSTGSASDPRNASPTSTASNDKSSTAQPRPGQSSRQPGESGSTDPNNNSTDPAGQSGRNPDNPLANNQGGNSQAPGQPGSAARAGNVTVDLNDPRALQRSAWGNLPERVREQMQSRMVERFLPSYRDEIEAYYRALVK